MDGQIYIQDSACVYSFNGYCIKSMGTSSININTAGEVFSVKDYVVYNSSTSYETNTLSATITKGKFVSKVNKYMVYNNGDAYPGGTTTSSKTFKYISGFDATSGKAILSNKTVTGCYYLSK